MMTPKIIVLWGNKDSGKSTTLKLLSDKLLALGGSLFPVKSKTKPTNDIAVTIQFNGKKIGIISAGDNDYFQKSGYESPDIHKDCDVYIFASRTKGSSCRFIRTTFPNNTIQWHEKWKVSTENGISAEITGLRDYANNAQADALIMSLLLN